MSIPRAAEITPTGSDTEEYPKTAWIKRYDESQTRYSPAESPQTSLPEYPNNSHASGSQQAQDTMDIDDEEMDDAPTFSQGSQGSQGSHVPQHDFLTQSGRLPTPINCHFPTTVRSGNNHTGNYGRGIAEATSRLKHDRRLPSPISEDESSPSVQLKGFGDIHMGSEHDRGNAAAPTKTGTRNWGHVSTGVGAENGGVKRLSMGYRSDCEKCLKKVPGHYMHLLP